MKFINHVQPIDPRWAAGTVAASYAEARRDFRPDCPAAPSGPPAPFTPKRSAEYVGTARVQRLPPRGPADPGSWGARPVSVEPAPVKRTRPTTW